MAIISNKCDFKLFVCLSFVYIIASSSAQWVIEDEGCRTPDNGVGNCILIKQCSAITNFIQNAPRPLSASTIKKLQKYTCGFQGSEVKVCCPNDPIDIAPTKQPALDIPDISRHRNLRLIPEECGGLDPDNRIIGGEKTRLFEFPWMALISYQTKQGPDFRCGGSILNDKYILTAAHCITNIKNKLIGVRVGEYNVPSKIDCEKQDDGKTVCAPPVQDLAIEEIMPHPQYNPAKFSTDIGLLRVTRIKFNQNTKPICMPYGEVQNINITNKKVTITGWGATEIGRNSPVLLKVNVPVITNEECSSIYRKQVNITEKQICAGGVNRKDSCPGDSGGPMQVLSYFRDDTRYVQMGVVSFGPSICGSEGLPGVYTKIAYYMDWILDNIRT